MTITFKPGNHPDADQLSAFIEQALPAHERDGVLAHLAVCPDCRAVVALALPEAPAMVAAHEPQRSSIGKSWFSNWMVVLPAAAAVAALALFAFFVHRQGSYPQQQAQITPAPAPAATPRQLEARSPAQPNAPSSAPNAEIAGSASLPAPIRRAKAGSAAMGSAGAIQSKAVQPAGSAYTSGQDLVTQNESVQSAPAQNASNSFAPAGNNAVVNQNQSMDQATVPRSVFHGAVISGALQSNDSLQQADANTQNRQQQKRLQQSQTVQVQAEAPPPLATESAELSTVVAGNAGSSLSFAQQPLPSGLPQLSSAKQGPIVLAIDTRHAVFVSSDSGQHWKTVRAVWKGRPVLVEAAAPVERVVLPTSGASMGFYAGMPQGELADKKAGITLTGTVTDQSGSVVPGATVTVTNPQANLARTTTTDANGRYVAAGLDPGNYDLDASAQGFMSNRLSNVAVTASKPNIANFTLRVGAAAESVTVEASQPSIELESAPRLKAAAKPKAAPIENAKQAPAPLFEIVTDKGVHWTSADGLTWQPK